MALTEVVFEIADPRHPLGSLTARDPVARAVYRPVEGADGVATAALTVMCTREQAAQLARDLQKLGHYSEVALVSLTPYAAVFRLRAAPKASVATEIAPVERILDVFGPDTVFQPFIVQGGRWRVRALLAESVETRRVLTSLGGLQRAMGWREFRTIRVAEFKATRYADSLRRLLDPEAEEVLRLAVRLGYYDSPKRCTLQAIAEKVGLSVSPVHKRLKNVEQVLIGAHVAPASVRAALPRRQRPRLLLAAEATMTEVTLSATWPGLPLSDFSRDHPSATVVFHPLADETEAAAGTTLVTVVAPPREARAATAALRERRGVEAVDLVSLDEDHVSVKVRSRSCGMPQVRLLRRIGRDVYLKPLVLEAGETTVSAILTHPSTDAEVRERVAAVAAEAHWDAWDIVDLKPVASDPALDDAGVDRLTARQEEILKIAHALGYYRTPRGCTLDEVARTLGISANAIHKNLSAAEQKIVGAYLAGG